MALIRDARTLTTKSIFSMKRAMSSFNSYDDDGRVCSVLLHLQHACEMLLKAVLMQNKVKVFDEKSGKSIPFSRALHICRQEYGLDEAEAGTMRMIDALRDAEQHWFTLVEEDVLYLHTRAIVTVFDSYIKRTLNLDLYSHIPTRVLPVSTKPPGNFDFLIDREFRLISELLQPGKRKRDEARARIRALLAMEGFAAEEVEISEKDINRIEKALKDGKELSEVFPRLNTVASTFEGDGPTVTVHFSKKEGAPVRYVAGDDPNGAAAVRQVDLQKKFYLGAIDLAKAIKLSPPKAQALRSYLKIEEESSCCHIFEFGKSKHVRFSDNAKNKMKTAIEDGLDIEELWKQQKRPSQPN